MRNNYTGWSIPDAVLRLKSWTANEKIVYTILLRLARSYPDSKVSIEKLADWTGNSEKQIRRIFDALQKKRHLPNEMPWRIADCEVFWGVPPKTEGQPVPEIEGQSVPIQGQVDHSFINTLTNTLTKGKAGKVRLPLEALNNGLHMYADLFKEAFGYAPRIGTRERVAMAAFLKEFTMEDIDSLLDTHFFTKESFARQKKGAVSLNYLLGVQGINYWRSETA